ncbi:hypothetical protein CDD83_7946 [Cordyceps sp. RAO-2017]|nr:hypothetical protein CDD83_7946 [Cordyceps sp. RAO-2017]
MELLPPYSEAQTSSAQDRSGCLPPATLRLDGLFVYPGDAGTTPLYETSLAVDALRDGNRTVTVYRLEQTVKQQGGAARISTRRHRLCELRHPTAITGPRFEYYAQTAQTVVGLTAHRHKLFFGKEYRFHRTSGDADDGPADGNALFVAQPGRENKEVRFEWSDGQGRLVARELARDAGPTSLVVSAEMKAAERDALVSAWMLRVWEEQANYSGKTWDDFKRIMKNSNNPELKGLRAKNISIAAGLV